MLKNLLHSRHRKWEEVQTIDDAIHVCMISSYFVRFNSKTFTKHSSKFLKGLFVAEDTPVILYSIYCTSISDRYYYKNYCI